MIQTRRFVAVFLTLGLAIASVAGCETDSSETPAGPLRVLITNDDGVQAEGIDAVVEALRDDPNYEIIVSAPAQNSSGTGDMTTPTPPPLEAETTTTASGYTATAVMGFPADAVIYALENLYPDAPPHVVLSGINQGQNVGNVGDNGVLSQISGTVGAAKTAACADIPALASSQGFGDPIDYGPGVVEVVAWLEENREALLRGQVPVDNITSINIPTCGAGIDVRGRVDVPLATTGSPAGPQDCESTSGAPVDDIDGFLNGYVTITPVPRNTTCPDK